MTIVNKITKTLGFGALLAGLFVGFAGSASACDSYAPASCPVAYAGPQYHDVWVVTYETRQVPYTAYVTVYDDCGHPVQVERTFWRTVSVPVRRLTTVAF